MIEIDKSEESIYLVSCFETDENFYSLNTNSFRLKPCSRRRTAKVTQVRITAQERNRSIGRKMPSFISLAPGKRSPKTEYMLMVYKPRISK